VSFLSEEWMTWIPTSIEHSGDYYFTARLDMAKQR